MLCRKGKGGALGYQWRDGRDAGQRGGWEPGGMALGVLQITGADVDWGVTRDLSWSGLTPVQGR